jgi:hypothetical protein
MSFIIAIELYKGYRIDRDFVGCILVGPSGFPWLELIASLIFGLNGISILKNKKQLLRFVILSSFVLCFSTILLIVIKFLWCSISLIGFGIYCIMDIPILELGGILFFTVILAEHRKFDWKKEIKEFGLKKYLICFVGISLLWLLLYNI